MSASASGRTISRMSGLLEDSRPYFRPRRTGRRILAISLKTAVQFCFLRRGQLQGPRGIRDAIPNGFHELETVSDRNGQNLGNADGFHNSNLPPSPEPAKPRHKVTSNVLICLSIFLTFSMQLNGSPYDPRAACDAGVKSSGRANFYDLAL